MCQCNLSSCETCNPIVVERGEKGNQGNAGQTGATGNQGWSPLLGLIQNDGTTTGTGNLFAMQFTSWTGGAGSSPTNPVSPNIYMQPDGTFGALATAINLKGPQGYYEHWLGTFATPPSSPNLLDAYRDSAQHAVYIWDGSAWRLQVQDGLSGGAGTPGVSITYLGNVTSLPGSPSLNQVYRLTTVTPPAAFLWNGTAWVLAWQDGTNGSNGTNGTNGVNGFNYETVDGNGIPAVATGPYQVLRRKSDNTGYEFVSPLQLKLILSQTK